MTTGLSIVEPAYFDRLADVEARHWWSRGVWQLGAYWLDTAVAGQTALRALDVGCGTGQTALRLAARDEIQEVIGLDPSPDALRHARRRHDFPLVRGSATALPFQDRHFNVVTCFDVFQHLGLGQDLQAAREIARVLMPRGLALIRSNARGWSGDDSTYRLEGLIAVMENAGFLIRRASLANALPALVQEFRGSLPRRWRRDSRQQSHPSGGGLQIRVPSPPVNALLGTVAETEAWLAGRLGFKLPFGHSTLVLAEVSG